MKEHNDAQTSESIAQGIYKETMIEQGFYILKLNNETTE
ncbi:MAG: hypothetical protein ACI849_001119, partial [Patiriisocius sp.]